MVNVVRLLGVEVLVVPLLLDLAVDVGVLLAEQGKQALIRVELSEQRLDLGVVEREHELKALIGVLGDPLGLHLRAEEFEVTEQLSACLIEKLCQLDCVFATDR